jgi:DNA ligase-1
MLLHELVTASQRVSATSKRNEKLGLLSEVLRRLKPEEIAVGVSYLSGNVRQGRIGVGWAMLRDARPESAADSPTLSLGEVDATLERIAQVRGWGSTRDARGCSANCSVAQAALSRISSPA